MTIVISTVNRIPNYLDQTMQSLTEADASTSRERVVLAVSGADADHTDKWAVRRPKLLVLTSPEADYPWFAGRHRHYRITLNLVMSMSVIANDPDDELHVVCEDDIRFEPNWRQRAKLILGDHPIQGPFCMTLSTPYPVESFRILRDTPGVGALMAHLYPNDFYGNMCLLVNRAFAEGYVRHMLEATADPSWGDNYQSDFPNIGDQSIKTFCSKIGAPIYATDPKLVHHIGEVSTWLPAGADRNHPPEN